MIYIIGGGPVGCYAAYLLGKKRQVRIFEEHETIGQPVQCTGIVTDDIYRYIPKKNSFVINKINDTRIFSPKGSKLGINFKKPDIILDRERFDRYFYKKAKSRKKNVRFYLGHKLLKITERSLVFERPNLKKMSFPLKKGDIVIGADGPLSKVYEIVNDEKINLRKKSSKKRQFFFGWQYRLKVKNDNYVDFFPKKKSKAWVVPESKDIVRAGIFGEKIKRDDFLDFLKKKVPGYRTKLIEAQGGLIPIYNPRIRFNRRIKNRRRDVSYYLIGDSAGLVKATSGGGLIPGLESARILKKSILNKKNYRKEIKKKLGTELFMHLVAHKIFSRMKNNDWNNLIMKFGDKDLKVLLSSVSRDNLKRLAVGCVMKKPSLLKFITKLL